MGSMENGISPCESKFFLLPSVKKILTESHFGHLGHPVDVLLMRFHHYG